MVLSPREMQMLNLMRALRDDEDAEVKRDELLEMRRLVSVEERSTRAEDRRLRI